MWYKKGLIGYIFLVMVFPGFLSVRGMAQCTQPLNSGHLFLTSTSGCTPHTIEIKNLYSNSTADTEYRIDWGDGTVDVLTGSLDPVDGGAFDPIYTPDFIHTYTQSTADCGYDILIEATNACTLAEDARLELSVTIWDTDQQGMMIGPQEVRVCQGYDASVVFYDHSDWNCYPRAIRQNDPPREIQWEYPGGTMGGISIPTLGAAPVSGPFESVMDPGSPSLTIPVPSENPLDPGNPYPIGAYFDVKLNNWNRCNPRMDGHDPVTDMARIIIVETPDPDFITRKSGPSNPEQTVFCVGDPVYFDNLTTAPGNADIRYLWEFYADSTGTGSPAGSSQQTDPVFSFHDSGKKLIRLTVRDDNAIGNCEKLIEKVIEISPTPQPRFEIFHQDNQVTDPVFCLETDSSYSIDLKFANTSYDTTANTSWQWELYDDTGQIAASYPSGGFSDDRIDTVNFNYNTRGNYPVSLTALDNLTGCQSSYIDTIHLLPSPEPYFTVENACERTPINIADQSDIDSMFSQSIIRWEWDLSYENDQFSPDSIFHNTMPDTIEYLYSGSGIKTIALRIFENENNCSAMYAREVELFPIPRFEYTIDPMEGCTPLWVDFQYNFPDSISGAGQLNWTWNHPEQGMDTITINTDSSGLHYSLTGLFENAGSSEIDIPMNIYAITEQGCSSPGYHDTLRVFPSLKTGFYAVDYDPLDRNCSPIPVNFRISSSTRLTNPDEYLWTIYDDQDTIHHELKNAAEPEMGYTFINSGSISKYFYIRVQATDEKTCYRDSTLRILINPVPSSAFNIDTVRLDCEEMEIRVQAFQKGLHEYYWKINEGTSTNEYYDLSDSYTYIFQRPDADHPDMPVTISLATVNQALCPGDTITEEFEVPKKTALNPYFEAEPDEMTFPEATIRINNYTETGPEHYQWDFGDGETSDRRHPGDHTYEQPGTYLVTLVVSEEFCEISYQDTVVIHARLPEVDFDWDPPEGCAPLTVNFTNLSRYTDPASYIWEFGDGQKNYAVDNPEHTYIKPGSYSVTLTASNSYGDTVSEKKEMIIQVYASPAVNFTIRPALSHVGETVYTTNFTEEAAEFFWDFGNNHFSNEAEPEFSYDTPGIYDITLYAQTENGCEGRYTMTGAVEVIEGGRVKVPNAFSPNPAGPNGGNIHLTGRNDVFYPITEGVSSFKMYIFNKWGEVLFYSDNLNTGWDGYFKGQLCPQDVYVYKLELEYTDGEREIKVGDVNLIR